MTEKQQAIIDWLVLDRGLTVHTYMYRDHSNPEEMRGWVVIDTPMGFKNLLKLMSEARSRGFFLNYETRSGSERSGLYIIL